MDASEVLLTEVHRVVAIGGLQRELAASALTVSERSSVVLGHRVPVDADPDEVLHKLAVASGVAYRL